MRSRRLGVVVALVLGSLSTAAAGFAQAQAQSGGRQHSAVAPPAASTAGSGNEDGQDQARDLPAVRQHPLPARQAERAVGPRADAASAQLPHGQRNAAHATTTRSSSRTPRAGSCRSLTGLYPDRNGQTVSNSYDYFTADGTSGLHRRSFKYWTDTSTARDDPLPNMITRRQARPRPRHGSRTRAPAATSAASRPRTSSSRTPDRRRPAT